MASSRIWRIGLTGGIGSGKSTVANMLAERGATIIDADAISRSVTAPGGRAMDEVLRVFGAGMVLPDGAMNRQAMRSRVFADPLARQQLEAIIHPLVQIITQEQVDQAIAQGNRCLVHDVPLLVESGNRWRAQLDRVVVIDCTPATQCARVMARNGMSLEEVERIMAQQASRTQRLSCADMVIFNEGLPLDELRHQVGQAATHFGL